MNDWKAWFPRRNRIFSIDPPPFLGAFGLFDIISLVFFAKRVVFTTSFLKADRWLLNKNASRETDPRGVLCHFISFKILLKAVGGGELVVPPRLVCMKQLSIVFQADGERDGRSSACLVSLQLSTSARSLSLDAVILRMILSLWQIEFSIATE